MEHVVPSAPHPPPPNSITAQTIWPNPLSLKQSYTETNLLFQHCTSSDRKWQPHALQVKTQDEPCTENFHGNGFMKNSLVKMAKKALVFRNVSHSHLCKNVLTSVSGIIGSTTCATGASPTEGATGTSSAACAETSTSTSAGVCSNCTASGFGASGSTGTGSAAGSFGTGCGSALGISTIGAATGIASGIFAGAGAWVLAAFLGAAAGGVLAAIPGLALTGGLAACCSSRALLWACCKRERQKKHWLTMT